MWYSGKETRQINSNKRVGSSSSSSKSSSSSASSCPSPFSPLPPAQKRTMEEVWKEISRSGLPQHANGEQRPMAAGSTGGGEGFRSFVFQDFLAGPLKEKPTGVVVEAGIFTPAAPPPPLGLSLNSGPERHCLAPTAFRAVDAQMKQVARIDCNSRDLPSYSLLDESLRGPAVAVTPFDVFGSNLPPAHSEKSSCDRRHKRMIKNRESAARSRARKQAYTNELELEVAYLMEENARLKQQQERQQKQQQFCVAAAAPPAQFPRKQSLQRTSTAPF